uniref:Uncharacterized protein n=1 Tax=Anguilla anguilla TaxID=7936 RepID=A0A0E9Q5H6_ANGAN
MQPQPQTHPLTLTGKGRLCAVSTISYPSYFTNDFGQT